MLKSTILATIIASLASSVALADESTKRPVYEFEGQKFRLEKFNDHVNTSPDKNIEKSNLPVVVDLERMQTKVKNQGDRGSCAYFAATALLESSIKRRANDENFDINISEEYLIYSGKAKYNMSSLDDGSVSLTNLKILNHEGFLLEKDAPYQPSWFTKGMPCEDEKMGKTGKVRCYSHDAPVNTPEPIKIKGFDLRNNYSNLNMMIKELANNKPVLIGVDLDPRTWDGTTGVATYNEEIREGCQKEPDVCGGHAILLVGYDLNKRVFKFKNSWGHDWGKSGYGTMSFDYVADYGDGGYSLDIGKLTSYDIMNSTPEAKISDVDYSVTNEYNPTTGEYELVTKASANVDYSKNGILYMSTFLSTDASGSSMLPVKTEHADEYGSTIRGYFYDFFKERNSLNFDMNYNPATLRIPHKLIDSMMVSNSNIHTRFSIYTYTDLDGWKVLYREFKPVTVDFQ